MNLRIVGGVAALATMVWLPRDQGAVGTWHKLLKLRTTASVLQTTAHPDDEQGGLLAVLSRKYGARVGLMTLTRGESGDNALGPQLFDALGLMRTEELRVADRYYGVDDQYFTTVVDYGFSKRLDEALEKWGHDDVLRDVVRVIRMHRPTVIVSRFQGNARDGHGNHQAAGLITQEAYKAAADPSMFPEQIAEGLRPWQALKLYMGGVRENEDWTVRVDTGEYSPWLGESYENFARTGLSFQRSQNSGRVRRVSGSEASFAYFKRLDSKVPAPAREESVFDGIDTSLGAAIDAAVKRAMDTFSPADPSACVPALVEGLKATRATSRANTTDAEAAFILRVKETQFQDAINAALGLELSAIAQSAGPVVPGQRFEIQTELTNHSSDRRAIPMTPADITLITPRGWTVSRDHDAATTTATTTAPAPRFTVALADTVAITSQPYFSRESIAKSRYTLSDPTQFGRPSAEPAATAVARYTVFGEPVDVRAVVQRREANPPYGDELRELMVVPRLAVMISPQTASAIIPLAAAKKQILLQVELLNNVDGGNAGELILNVPDGWTFTPEAHEFRFSRAGERATFQFSISARSIENRAYAIEAIAHERPTLTTGSAARHTEYRDGYEILAQRDLETRYLYRPAIAHVRGVDVNVVSGLNVGYVMGIGDQVPASIAQLGATVTLLGPEDLANGNLSRFDTIITGTRAYAVRDDLRTFNRRLLEYVKNGGNLIVLYNTPEFVPTQFAPYPAQLPADAEEVSEEDSPVDILAPNDQAFTWPNVITTADFDGWVEQRGSKFFSTWDKAYTPMISTFDRNQPAQHGGWLSARYGNGRYTYFAYALHRQLPYGVPGAYRLLANLLALNKVAPNTPNKRNTPDKHAPDAVNGALAARRRGLGVRFR